MSLHRAVPSVVVEDVVESAGSHECRLAYHLGPEVECFLDGNLALLGWPADSGQWRAIMRLPERLAWAAVRGQTQPPLGWYSPCFGAKLPIVTLVGTGVVAGGERMITEIRISLPDHAPERRAVDQIALMDASGR